MIMAPETIPAPEMTLVTLTKQSKVQVSSVLKMMVKNMECLK